MASPWTSSPMIKIKNITNTSYLDMNDGILRHIYATYFFAAINIYILLSLLWYEFTSIPKPPSGKNLRVYCIITSLATVFHSCSEQIIFYASWRSDIWCAASMCLKSTTYNLVTTFSYIFLWVRQRMFYRNPTLNHLVSPKMKVANWTVFALIVINPFVFFAFQFIVELYKAVPIKGCIVQRVAILNQLPFIVVAFSYSIIQVCL